VAVRGRRKKAWTTFVEKAQQRPLEGEESPILKTPSFSWGNTYCILWGGSHQRRVLKKVLLLSLRGKRRDDYWGRAFRRVLNSQNHLSLFRERGRGEKTIISCHGRKEKGGDAGSLLGAGGEKKKGENHSVVVPSPSLKKRGGECRKL